MILISEHPCRGRRPYRARSLGRTFSARFKLPVSDRTLIERQTRFAMLIHLPVDHSAITVRDGLLAASKTLPAHLARSLTRDQGIELTQHRQITMATKMAISFCDPHSPWQLGSKENLNGLPRQYFPKGTDLSVHSPQRLLEVATEINDRPPKPSAESPPHTPYDNYRSNQRTRSLQRPLEYTDY